MAPAPSQSNRQQPQPRKANNSNNNDSSSAPSSSSSSSSSSPSWPITILTASLMGLLFGLAFYKSHVYEPSNIRGQFLFRRFVMLKVFFGSMGTGALLFSMMSTGTTTSRNGSKKLKAKFDAVRELWRPTSLTRGYITGPGLGGTILGIGMAASGACPGMVWTALGSGVEHSTWTIAGCLLGAFVYGTFAEGVQRHVLNRGPLGPCDEVYADEVLGHRSSPSRLMMALGAFCLAGCAALEVLVPWREEVPYRLKGAMGSPVCDFGTGSFSFVECPAWPPSVAGVLIGLLQLPGVVLIGNVLGSATAFQICSSLLLAPLPSNLKAKLSTRYTDAFGTPNPLSWWQLPYVAAAALSASVCAAHSSDVGGADGVRGGPTSAFLGGFALAFGSRLGGGCTSGHGMSGCALLMVQSWVAVPAMFAGGIATAVAMQSIGGGEFFRED